MKTKEEILDEVLMKKFGEIENSECIEVMEIYAKQESIEFFKWYAMKMHGFIIYIKDIRPQVTSQEIEEKLSEFEGKPFDKLYELFQKEKLINV